MYQFPVKSVDKIRRTRRKVKHVLSDLGLEECQSLFEKLKEFDAGDDCFNDTDWTDFTEGFNGKRKKKWKYRTRPLCCGFCRFSSRSWHSFETHIQRCHSEEENQAAISACPSCPFIAHPTVVSKHCRIFHSDSQMSVPAPLPTKSPKGYIFQCRKCSIQDSLLYCMKKHVLIVHHTLLFNQLVGRRSDSELEGQAQLPQFYCKACKLPAETSEHLLYHLLTSEKHKDLDMIVQAQIFESPKTSQKIYPSLAPKIQVSPTPIAKPIVAAMSDQQSLAAGSVSGTVLQGVENNGAALVCGPGTSQTFLPAQASALVQLASAEAKGLLRPSAPVSLQNPPPVRAIAATLPTVGGIAPAPALQPAIPPKQLPIAVGVPRPLQPPPPPRQVLLPPGVQINVPVRGQAPQPLLVTQRMPLNQPTPRGTMLTSQSLLSHLIPTGNKVNGLPTYTLAPLQIALPVQSNNAQAVNKATLPMSQTNSLPQANKPADSLPQDNKMTKKWITCPICNELFPSNIYYVHVEIHKESSKKSKLGLAARAPFLQKMPDKTVKCLMCKILLSEKGVYEHLLHGLNCLYCPGMFYSMKQLVEHIQVEHKPTQKANCDFMRREYRLYTDDSGNLLFPYFDIKTSAPKEMMGDRELNLALVTNTLDLIFLKILPSSPQAVCSIPMKFTGTDCAFCSENLMNMECYQMHLREKHFIVPTMHAILKTPAYKCIYCSGVYTGKTTTKAITVHISRCRCAPKTAKDAERLMSSGLMGRAVAATPVANQGSALSEGQPGPNASHIPASMTASVPAPQAPETEAELQSKLRLEIAVKEAIEANKREREARLARKRKLEKDRMSAPPLPPPPPPPPPKVQIDPTVEFALDCTGMELRSFDDRREFLTKYFNTKPYLPKKELEALSFRLLLTKPDVACHFAQKRTKCMRFIRKNKPVVLLGFNMAELMKVKHNLVIPEVEPEKTSQ
ncbi:activity-dependent neuroprotector homeobox protein 2b [Chanos chanos]|uniref:Activity-dependent neuroprotector homeobox protein 2b n=1 Tax=Chanos chanos TaxID=29144 RepID=A0A6J2WL07_CHACN|nr:activity-dependent neuroprotector homeobox protein 2 [Chanos chanos]